MSANRGQRIEGCAASSCWLEKAAAYVRASDLPMAGTVLDVFESLSRMALWKGFPQISSGILPGMFRYEQKKDVGRIPFRSQLTRAIENEVRRTGKDNPCLFTVRNAVRGFLRNNPAIVRSLRPVIPRFWGNDDLIYLAGHSPDPGYQTVDADAMNEIIEKYRENGLPVLALVNRFKGKRFIGRHYVAIEPQMNPFDDGQRLPYMDPGASSEKNGRGTLVFDEARKTWIRLPIEPPPGRPYKYRYEMIGLFPYSSSATDGVREMVSRRSKSLDSAG